METDRPRGRYAVLAVDEGFVDDLLVRLAPLGELRARRMFGGIGLYCDEVFFALIDAGVLFFKVGPRTVEDYRAAGSAPFRPFPDKPPMPGYYEVPLGVLERDEELRAWAARALQVARERGAEKKARKTQTRKTQTRKAPRPKAAPVPVAKLLNIGPKSAAWLRAVGIETRADLERVGSVQAYRLVAAAGFESSLNLLYALEGALLELRWDRLSAAVKQNLRERAGRARRS
ncbi:MAG: TfoX/Sxy family DNA transformation protein [Planctomycetes bacterium]|nr:TfoX/Sxy family DNA transformation protein [Planctomycetota bacterium]